jgi:excisionase family DNA binding protein
MSGPNPPRTSRRPLLTAAEVARILNISIRQVRRLIKDGKLPIVRVGRAVRIRPESLDKLIDGE